MVLAPVLVLLSSFGGAPAGAEGFAGESVSVADFAGQFGRMAPELRQRQGALRMGGILTESVSSELERLDQVQSDVEQGRPVAPASARPASRVGPGGEALAQLRLSPGARSGEAPEIGDTVALNRDGRQVPKDDEEAVRERIDRLVREKTTPAAQKAFRSLLWLVWRATPAQFEQATPEARVLFSFLREQLQADQDGSALPRILYEPGMPANILATYRTGSNTIRVGPTFASLPDGGAAQITVLTHEGLHRADDGLDGSAIAQNRLSGRAYDAGARAPWDQNAAEALAYTDMPQWLHLVRM